MDFNRDNNQNNNQNNGDVENQNFNSQNVSNQQYTNQQYTNQPYGTAPVYNQVPVANPNNGFAIGALVCGILSVVLCCCVYGILSLILGILAIVFAVLSKKQNGGKLSGLAIAGLICGCVGLLFSVIYIICYAVLGTALYSELKNFSYYY